MTQESADLAFACVQTTWARRFASGLVAAGIRDVVVSPGSRSTPILLALLERPELHCVAVADERSASFFALGQVRSCGQPSALLCTSGSAAGHYLPAVMEAAAARLPLLVLSANRPPERDHCEAPQTTDQERLYGVHARAFYSLGPADGRVRSLRALDRTVARAVACSKWPIAGPVHIDLRARKPLELVGASLDLLSGTSTEVSSSAHCADFASTNGTRPFPRVEAPTVHASGESIARLARALAESRRPLLVAGPAGLAQAELRGVARELIRVGVPAAFELASQLGGVGDLVSLPTLMQSRTLRAKARPDLLIQIGSALTSSGWEPWVESLQGDGAAHWVVCEAGWPDPVSSASEVVVGAISNTLERLLALLIPESHSNSRSSLHREEWNRWLSDCDREGRSLIDEAASRSGSEAEIARVCVDSLPQRGALLALGNSLAIRLAESFAPRPELLAVWNQRGLNGIDGIVSGFAGTLERRGRDAVPFDHAHLLIGDVSFLHDVGGLIALRDLAPPGFAVVVIDNGGGRIFDRLPAARNNRTRDRWEFFTTPPAVDLAAVARAFGFEVFETSSGAELSSVLSDIRVRRARAVVRVMAEPGAEAEDHRRLVHALDSRFSDWPAAGLARDLGEEQDDEKTRRR